MKGSWGEVLLGKIEKIFKRCYYMKTKEEESRNYELPKIFSNIKIYIGGVPLYCTRYFSYLPGGKYVSST